MLNASHFVYKNIVLFHVKRSLIFSQTPFYGNYIKVVLFSSANIDFMCRDYYVFAGHCFFEAAAVVEFN